MNSAENKTSQDAETRVFAAMKEAAKKGKWMALVFSVEDRFPQNIVKRETMTSYNFPTGAFLQCVAMSSTAMFEEVERINQKDVVPPPLPIAPGFDRPTVPFDDPKKIGEEMVAEEEAEIARQDKNKLERGSKENLNQLREDVEIARQKFDEGATEAFHAHVAKDVAKQAEPMNFLPGDHPPKLPE